MNRLQEIKKRKREIAAEARSGNLSNEQIRSLNEELAKLNLEELQLEEESRGDLQAFETQEQRNQHQGQLRSVSSFNYLALHGQVSQQQGTQRSHDTEMKNFEQRSAQFESGRAVQFDIDEAQLRSITTSNVPLEGHSSKRLNPGLLEVSSVVDLVKTIPLQGGESYKSGFIVSSGSAGYTEESADYYENEDVKTDYVKIDKAKITTYFELPEEVYKLGGTHYMGWAQEAARTAIRKKMAQQIMIGTGGTNALQGIFTAPINVIPADSDIEVTDNNLPHDMLDQIVFNHGGDEAVEGGAYLILNKQTLAEFAKMRTSNGDPLYKIELDINGNVGSISSRDSFKVPFIINSAVKSWKDATAGDYFLAYGKPLGYELAQFSGIEVQQSTDFKFKSGQICVRASVHCGGNTASYKGFTRIKKATV